MKNKFLLLGATALLSAGLVTRVGAIIQNDYISKVIHATVDIANSISVEEKQVLHFGTIIEPKGGQMVVVTEAGQLGSGTTATVIGNTIDVYNETSVGGVRNGRIVVSGLTSVSDYIDASMTLDSDISLETEGGTTCGTVSIPDASGTYSTTDQKMNINYGGTLTLDADVESIEGDMRCSGTGTVTIIYGRCSSNGACIG